MTLIYSSQHRYCHLIISVCALGETRWFTVWLRLTSVSFFFRVLRAYIHIRADLQRCMAPIRTSITPTRSTATHFLRLTFIGWPQTLPLGVGQLLSLAANVTVTQVIGTLCSLSGLPPLFHSPPPARQTKEVFTESNQYKMKPCLDCQLPISSLPFQSSMFR